MALDPSDIGQIVNGLVAALGPNILYGYIAAAATSVLITLALTIPRGAKMVEKKMLDPQGAVAKARAVELANFKTEVAAVLTDKLAAIKMPGAVSLEARLADLPSKTAFAAMGEDFQEIKNRTTDEHLLELMGTAIRNHEMAARARAGKGEPGEITDADMEVIGAAGSIAEHPEQAQMAAGLIQLIEVGIDTGMIKEKGGLKTIGKIQDALAMGKDLSLIRERISMAYPTLAARASGSGGGTSGGKSGPAQF